MYTYIYINWRKSTRNDSIDRHFLEENEQDGNTKCDEAAKQLPNKEKNIIKLFFKQNRSKKRWSKIATTKRESLTETSKQKNRIQEYAQF